MLGKLIKYEWKNTWKTGCLLLIGLALITFLGWLSFQSQVWQAAESGGYNRMTVWDILSFAMLMLYVVLLIVINYGILVYVGVRFYKTMYTDEGYLLHTLPVTKHQLLLSKILIGGVWSLLILLGVYLSVFLLALSMIGVFMPADYTYSQLLGEFFAEFGNLDVLCRDLFDMGIASFSVMTVLITLISPFASITVLFGAISIGQLFTKHRVLMAIVSYIGIVILESIINSSIQGVFTTNLMARSMYVADNSLVGGYINTTLITSFISSLVSAGILYGVSYYVTSKKLNLE